MPPQKKRSGPTKLTPERITAICNAIVAGATFQTAAQFAGVSERTLKLWRAKGREQKRGPYKDLEVAVRTALAKFEVAAVAKIREAGESPKCWTALAWLLERRFPERWARPEVKAELFGDHEERAPKRIRIPFAPPRASEPEQESGPVKRVRHVLSPPPDERHTGEPHE